MFIYFAILTLLIYLIYRYDIKNYPKGKDAWINAFMVILILLAGLRYHIDTDAVIGNNVFVKVGAWVGDHAVVGEHCFIGAKSTVGGGVKIGEQCFIGLGAIIFDDTNVGKKCIVGAATALKHNLPDYSVYKTSCDNYTSKTYLEDAIESKLEYRKKY